MSVNVKKIVESLKEASLVYRLEPKSQVLPNTLSHIGGLPYSEEGDHRPICRNCKAPMRFIFQLHIPSQKSSKMYCFYYCYHCQTDEGNRGFSMKIYNNPSPAKIVKREKWNSLIPYAEFEFDANWSLPEWNALPFIDKSIQPAFLHEYKENAEIEYETMVDEILKDQSFDSFSYFGGHPKFLGFPQYPVCSHCKQNMELFMQLDSEDEKGLIWSDFGCLYIFRCKTGKEHFHILIQ